MAAKPPAPGREELRATLKKSRGLFRVVFLFSIFANILVLTGPLFMLQVYDRVLSSRSEATLVALFALVAILYGIMGVLDYARGRILGRVGARFQSMLDHRVFDALLRRSVDPNFRNRPATGLRDLESIQRLLSSPALFAFYDLPWTPLFLFAIFIFHPILGWFAVAGGIVLIIATVLNQIMSKSPQRESMQASASAEAFAEAVRRDAEVVQSLGMRDAVLGRWRQQRDLALDTSIQASDVSGSFSTFSKTWRFFLQSGMLAVAAYLVLQGELTPGAMIAGSILLGRALAPIEQVIAQWSLVQRARQGWTSLTDLLEATPEEEQKTDLPRPRALLDVQGLTVVPPSEKVPTLRAVSFRVGPGMALGVIGQSASGKSTLARAITGIWPAFQGKVRLDGAALEQFSSATLGTHIGYLPQDVSLFDASVADNIARLSPNPDPAQIVAAAKKAGAHEMILKLPEGYDTRIQSGGSRLSGGQRQRLGLARAMYGNPVLLVLDEPNANLDSEGTNALNAAIEQIKAEGGAVIIMAHRPAGIAQCELLLVMENGAVKDFGKRDDVLRNNLKNYEQVANVASPKPDEPAQVSDDAQKPQLNAPSASILPVAGQGTSQQPPTSRPVTAQPLPRKPAGPKSPAVVKPAAAKLGSIAPVQAKPMVDPTAQIKPEVAKSEAANPAAPPEKTPPTQPALKVETKK